MKQIKSSAALKADARQQLLGKYKTVILAYLIMQFLISGCMNLAQAQVNLNTGAGMGIYYLIYFILLLLSAIFITGQNQLYKNIARGLPYYVKDMWVGFHGLADHAILVHLIIFGLCLLAGIPFILHVRSWHTRKLLPVPACCSNRYFLSCDVHPFIDLVFSGSLSDHRLSG